VVNHELGQRFAINEHDLGVNARDVVHRLGGEIGCADEESLLCALSRQCADEFLYLWPSDGVLPSLRLNVDCIEPEFIFFDDSVDTAIT